MKVKNGKKLRSSKCSAASTYSSEETTDMSKNPKTSSHCFTDENFSSQSQRTLTLTKSYKISKTEISKNAIKRKEAQSSTACTSPVNSLI